MKLSMEPFQGSPSPDAHWVLRSGYQIQASCSLWWRHTSSLKSGKVGCIGHYQADNDCAAHQLLNHACAELKKHGCSMAAGPINGNTWQSYRAIIDRGNYPLFTLEPNHPDSWPEHFRQAGFSVLSQYHSTLHSSLDYDNATELAIHQRMNLQGVEICPLDFDNAETTLDQIFDVSLQSFKDSFLYTPISREEFHRLYHPYLSAIDPRLVLIAYHRDKPVGFIFAIPNWAESQRGQTTSTIVIKTIAILPDPIYKGLGQLLWASLYRQARHAGFTQAIHAFMREDNRTFQVSSSCTQTIRRYALFGRELSV